MTAQQVEVFTTHQSTSRNGSFVDWRLVLFGHVTLCVIASAKAKDKGGSTAFLLLHR